MIDSNVSISAVNAKPFEPARGPRTTRAKRIDVDALANLASEILSQRQGLDVSFDERGRAEALRDILRVGTSAGGGSGESGHRLQSRNPRVPFADGEFDLVTLKHVLEHTPNPRQALVEVQRVLAPEGLVMITVPSLLYWKAWLLPRSCRYFRPDDLGRQHSFYCTPESLQTLVAHAGLDVLCISKAFFRPRGWQAPLSALGGGIGAPALFAIASKIYGEWKELQQKHVAAIERELDVYLRIESPA